LENQGFEAAVLPLINERLRFLGEHVFIMDEKLVEVLEEGVFLGVDKSYKVLL